MSQWWVWLAVGMNVMAAAGSAHSFFHLRALRRRLVAREAAFRAWAPPVYQTTYRVQWKQRDVN